MTAINSPIRLTPISQTERKEHGTTRQSILHLLRRYGQLTASELSEYLHIGAVGVRQHLTLLERDGLVEIAGLRRSIGRPSYLYTLTPDAEQHFPKAYDSLALSTINFVSDKIGVRGIIELFERWRIEQYNLLAPQLHDRAGVERVQSLVELLNEQGYMAEYEAHSDGSCTLSKYNCPIDCVARQYPQICQQETILYEHLLHATAQREASLLHGSCCCRYRITFG